MYCSKCKKDIKPIRTDYEDVEEGESTSGHLCPICEEYIYTKI